MLKKCLAVGIICILMLVTIPSTPCTEIKSTENVEPLGDRPKINVTLPDAHLYYHELKFRYADVEFNDTGIVIDINLSGIPSDEVLLGFLQKVYLHIQNQIIPTWVVWSCAINYDDPRSVSSGALRIGEIDNWQVNMTHRWTVWNVLNPSNISIDIAIVGVPPWLPFLSRFHAWSSMFYLIGINPLPFVKIYGGIATYQANIHK